MIVCVFLHQLVPVMAKYFIIEKFLFEIYSKSIEGLINL